MVSTLALDFGLAAGLTSGTDRDFGIGGETEDSETSETLNFGGSLELLGKRF